MKPAQRGKQSDPMRDMAPFMHMGVQLAAAIALCGAIGWFIDDASDTQPVWFVTGMVFGIIAGMVHFIRQALAADNKKKPDDKTK